MVNFTLSLSKIYLACTALNNTLHMLGNSYLPNKKRRKHEMKIYKINENKFLEDILKTYVICNNITDAFNHNRLALTSS